MKDIDQILAKRLPNGNTGYRGYTIESRLPVHTLEFRINRDITEVFSSLPACERAIDQKLGAAA